MKEHSAFDHQPDPRLGDALRDALTRPDEPAFVDRVVASLDASAEWWEVLGAWARPGLAASLLLAAAAGVWLGRGAGSGSDPGITVIEAVGAGSDAGVMTALLDVAQPPAIDALLVPPNGND